MRRYTFSTRGRASHRLRRDADLFFEDLLEDSPSASSCARDVAVSDTLALLITKSAPLAVTSSEIARVARDNGARDDYKSVAAIVPPAPHRRLLIFFHGNNNYVTLA